MRSSDRARLLFGRTVVLLAGLASMDTAALLALQRGGTVYEIFVTLAMILAGGIFGLFALGFFSRRVTRRGAYVGIVICTLFVLWATVTGPLGADLAVNFTLHPITIGIFSNVILFVSGYVASRVLGGHRPELAALTLGDSSRAAGHGLPALAAVQSPDAQRDRRGL